MTGLNLEQILDIWEKIEDDDSEVPESDHKEPNTETENAV